MLPDDLLRPGTRDAHRLLTLWVIRRSAFAIACLGLIVGILVAPGNDIDAEVDSASDIWDELLSPAAGISLAIVIRVGTSIAGLALAAPAARAFDAARLATTRRSGGRVSRLIDGVLTTRGLRSLRFTRHVRDAAVARLGAAAERYERIDRGITVASFALPVVFILVATLLGRPRANVQNWVVRAGRLRRTLGMRTLTAMLACAALCSAMGPRPPRQRPRASGSTP